MSGEKRWLKQVIKEAADKHFEMPWKQDPHTVAYINLRADREQAEAAYPVRSLSLKTEPPVCLWPLLSPEMS